MPERVPFSPSRPEPGRTATNRRLGRYLRIRHHGSEKSVMLRWALLFFIISIVAGLLGFTGISAASAGIAKILFGIFIVITIILVIAALAVGQFFF
jgi:uncharacterized membrane protein YtjA (UPF0391 family)